MQPELVARHYDEAGCHEKAAHYWHAAGMRSAQRSANVEAVSHLRRALDQISALPETSECEAKELADLKTLGPVLIATRGYGATDVRMAYSRAKTLCDRVGTKSDQFPVLRGLWNSYLFDAEMAQARERAEELMHLAERFGAAELHRLLGVVHSIEGSRDDVQAERHYLDALELARQQQAHSLELRAAKNLAGSGATEACETRRVSC
jgi:predicted ATPase